MACDIMRLCVGVPRWLSRSHPRISFLCVCARVRAFLYPSVNAIEVAIYLYDFCGPGEAQVIGDGRGHISTHRHSTPTTIKQNGTRHTETTNAVWIAPYLYDFCGPFGARVVMRRSRTSSHVSQLEYCTITKHNGMRYNETANAIGVAAYLYDVCGSCKAQVIRDGRGHRSMCHNSKATTTHNGMRHNETVHGSPTWALPKPLSDQFRVRVCSCACLLIPVCECNRSRNIPV